jgi:predicted DNA-binding protein (UPF0251 family)
MHAKLIAFVMEQAENQPISRRVELYRELSAELSKTDQTELLRLIDQLEAANEKVTSSFSISRTALNETTGSRQSAHSLHRHGGESG